MNEEIQIKIIELIDDGATLEHSSELKKLVDSSEEAKSFYKNILNSNSAINAFFGGDNANKLSNKIDDFVNDKFNKSSQNSSINFKPIIGFAIAASIAAISFIFLSSPSQIVKPESASYEKSQITLVEQMKPIYISGMELVDGLWGPATQLAKEMGFNRYQIMYAIYQGNKESFINNDINLPKQNENFLVDLSLVEHLETNFVVSEVKRHIFCSC